MTKHGVAQSGNKHIPTMGVVLDNGEVSSDTFLVLNKRENIFVAFLIRIME